MSIVILIAPTAENATSAWATLRQTGLADALPSRRERLMPLQVQQFMLKTMQQRLDASPSPVKTSTHTLDKIWTELAADLVLANVDAPRFGWHQTLDAYTPGFWQRFDPHSRFVLVYENPAQFVARNLVKHDHFNANANTTNDDTCQSLLQTWHSSHNQLLDTFYALGADAVLVHIDQVRCAWALLGFSESDASSPEQPLEATTGVALLTRLVQALVRQDAQAHALWQEMQAAAHAPMAEITEKEQTALDDVNDCLQLQSGLLTAHQALEASRQQMQEQQEEGELLILHLHQVQEELEHYFVQYQQQKKQLQVITQFWCRHPPSELWVDMRHIDDGHGWYEAEADARWSGPGTASTIELPPLAAGQYLLELHIADAMAPELVADMQLVAQLDDGQVVPLALVHEFGAAVSMYPMVSAGILELPANVQGGWQLRLVLPHVVSPAEQGGNDTRQLGLRLQGLRLSLQQVDQSVSQVETME